MLGRAVLAVLLATLASDGYLACAASAVPAGGHAVLSPEDDAETGKMDKGSDLHGQANIAAAAARQNHMGSQGRRCCLRRRFKFCARLFS